LGNKKLESYEEIVEELFPHTVPWGATCRWNSISFNFTWFFSPGNVGAVSDEHGERFHQHIPRNEKRYSSKWNPYTLNGRLYGRQQQNNTRDNRGEHEFLMVHLFIFIKYVVNR
jgi:hypothetical protein